MALVTKPYTFTDGQVAEAPQVNSDMDTLYNLVNGNIDHTNMSPTAALPDSMLNQITTGGKVAGSAITTLGDVPAGSTALPVTAGGTGSTEAANGAGGAVVLNGSAQLPAVSGALLTNLPTFTTQNVVTGSRTVGTSGSPSIYHNTTGKTMYVVATMATAGSGSNSITAYTDANATPSTLVDGATAGAGGGVWESVKFMVLNGNYYQVQYSSQSVTLQAWVEWY